MSEDDRERIHICYIGYRNAERQLSASKQELEAQKRIMASLRRLETKYDAGSGVGDVFTDTQSKLLDHHLIQRSRIPTTALSRLLRLSEEDVQRQAVTNFVNLPDILAKVDH